MLVQATPEQARERDRLSAHEWEPSLSAEAFVAREQVLQRSAFALRSRVPWAWLDPTGVVLASAETYEVRWPQGRVWLVASVWTEPGLRGRGHASRMLAALAARCAAEPGAAALGLFSDVGPALYARLGFVALPAVDVCWPAESADPDDGPWRRFSEAEVSGLSARDPLHLDWQLDRFRTLAEVRPARRPSRCGARLPSGDWMVWSDDGHGSLEVLEVSVGSVDTWSTLAVAAARSAAAAGLGEVVAWEAGLPVPGLRRPRVGKLPMVLPFGGIAASAFGPMPRWAWV